MIIYDCEIIKAIPSKKSPKMPDIEYCEGWHDIGNMGISVITAYDYAEQRYRVFLQDNFDEFQALVDKQNTIIGYNSLAFDNNLCRANGLNVPDEKSFDLLVQIWKAAGLSETFQYPTHMGYGLDAVSAVNFNTKKTGNGALAPVYWQRGEYGKVIDYCLNDVILTKALIDKVIKHGVLINPKDQKTLLEITIN